MKKHYQVLSLILLLSALLLQVTDTQAQWSTASLSQPRSSIGATSAGGKVFFAGGGGPPGTSNVVDIYDTVTNIWSTATLSQARSGVGATNTGGKVFFAGGGSPPSGASNRVDIYDTATNIWSMATLSQARSGVGATSAGGKVFFAGGITGSSASAVVDIYDTATNSWTTASLSQPRNLVGATRAGGKVFFAGGHTFSGISNVVDIYDTATNAWSTASLPQARREIAAISIGSKVFFGGGQLSSGYSAAVDIYDTATNTWSAASLSQARTQFSATSAGGKVFFAGGYSNTGFSAVVDIYDMSTNTWSISSLSQTRYYLSATSAGGKAFFAGGASGPYTLAVVDIYSAAVPTSITQGPTPASQTLCVGGTAASSVTATGQGLTYQWYRNQPDTDEPVAGQTAATLSLSGLTVAQGGTYYLRVSGEGGVVWSAAFNLTVNPRPDAGFSGLSGPYCVGTAALPLTPITPGGNFSLTGLGSLSGNIYTPPASGGGSTATITYSITVNGCDNTSQQTVQINAQTVSVPILNGTSFCAGQTLSLSFSAACPGLYTAELSDENGSFALPLPLGVVNPDAPNALTLPISLPSGSGYTIRVVGGSSPGLTSAFNVQAVAFPGTPTLGGSKIQTCAGSALTLSFTTNCTQPISGLRAQLSDRLGSFSSGGTTDLGPVNSGSSSVVIPSSVPHGPKYRIRIVVGVGGVVSTPTETFHIQPCPGNDRLAEVQAEEKGLQVRVSPNPTEGLLRVSVSGASGQTLRSELFNASGQVVSQQQIEIAEAKESLTWDISRQPQGLYLLRVSTEREAKMVKVVH
ncbi:MAG: T9SS type A sorting domain-containing protein [Cytophagaceae bacterium]|nr:T9SS type A sorting domain-containing protein [Cytophagaceae bacterium]